MDRLTPLPMLEDSRQWHQTRFHHNRLPNPTIVFHSALQIAMNFSRYEEEEMHLERGGRWIISYIEPQWTFCRLRLLCSCIYHNNHCNIMPSPLLSKPSFQLRLIARLQYSEFSITSLRIIIIDGISRVSAAAKNMEEEKKTDKDRERETKQRRDL